MRRAALIACALGLIAAMIAPGAAARKRGPKVVVPATITLTASPGKVDQRISFSGQVTSTKGCQAGRHLIVFGDFGLGADVVTAPDGTFSGTIGAPPFPMASYGVYVDGDATKRKFRGKAIRCRAVGTNTAVVVTN